MFCFLRHLNTKKSHRSLPVIEGLARVEYPSFDLISSKTLDQKKMYLEINKSVQTVYKGMERVSNSLYIFEGQFGLSSERVSYFFPASQWSAMCKNTIKPRTFSCDVTVRASVRGGEVFSWWEILRLGAPGAASIFLAGGSTVA